MYRLTLFGFLARWGISFAIVAVVYNPTRWNLVLWMLDFSSGSWPAKGMVALVLVLTAAVYHNAVITAIGQWGAIGIAAFFGAAVWQMHDWQWVTWFNTLFMQIAGMVTIATIMTIGLSWSHILQRLTGQLEMDFED